VGQHEVAAGGQRVDEAPYDPVGILVVPEEDDDPEQHQRDRPREVQRVRGVFEDAVDLAQVGVQVEYGAAGDRLWDVLNAVTGPGNRPGV